MENEYLDKALKIIHIVQIETQNIKKMKAVKSKLWKSRCPFGPSMSLLGARVLLLDSIININ